MSSLEFDGLPCDDALQTRDHLLEILEPADLGAFETAELLLPCVEGVGTDRVFSAEFLGGNPGSCLS